MLFTDWEDDSAYSSYDENEKAWESYCDFKIREIKMRIRRERRDRLERERREGREEDRGYNSE